ncbi:MAG: prevent-host-death protein [Demequina sp.]|jgi:hypothetical protein|nr:prevent-host-death protein [Demequina sp.]
MSTAMRKTVQSSDLSRHSAEVFAAADRHAVRITRRDGEPLLLMSEGEDRARQELVAIAGTLLAAATDGTGNATERIVAAYPWMLALNEAERATCAQELLIAARASFATGQPRLALSTLESWRETACAIAEGLDRLPVEWLDEPVIVPAP